LSIRFLINLVGMGHSLLKQFVKSPVVFHKKVCDRPCSFVISWFHLLSSITPPLIPPLTQLTSPHADELRNVGLQDPTPYLPPRAGVADVRS
jgi:hypothetical protein